MSIPSPSAARRAFAMAVIFFALASLASAQGRARNKSYDTNGDRTSDVTIRETDTDGDGVPDKVHVDCDGDGVEDPNEIVIVGRGSKGVNWGGGGGNEGIKIHITADTGTETVKSVLRIHDQNGDGDTCDPGEVAPAN